ncbi:hypothetical protein ACVWWK_002613 [Bradyrhizobium sp. LB9.1b]
MKILHFKVFQQTARASKSKSFAVNVIPTRPRVRRYRTHVG